MTSRIVCLLAVAMAAASCGRSPTPQIYTLDSTATADGAAAASYAVAVGPVSVPASVDQPQFVLQVAPNRVTVDEFSRWASPLSDGIARAVAGNLAVLLGTPRVATAPFANFDPTYRVTIDVQRFESVPGQTALVDAVWAVRRADGGASRTGRTTAHETVEDKTNDALAAAHSRALATVSAGIAAAIRADALAGPRPRGK